MVQLTNGGKIGMDTSLCQSARLKLSSLNSCCDDLRDAMNRVPQSDC